MKKIRYIAAIAFSVLCLAACKDALTRTPETDLSPESFFSNSAELELWTNRFYNLLEDADEIGELCADDIIGISLNGVQKGTRSASTQSWSWTYMRYINDVFEKDINCTDEAVKAKYEGVAHFFRAFMYFRFVRQFGDVPYYDHTISADDKEALNRPRDSRGFVMKKVMEDLDLAYEELPEAWSSNPTYHVSKAAAMALKSRAALFEGTFRKYHNIPDETIGDVTVSAEWFLGEAADAAKKVMDMNKYSLYSKSDKKLDPNMPTPYREYFSLYDTDGGETILSKRYNADIKVSHSLQFDMNSKKESATKRFVNHYLMADGTPIQAQPGWETMDYYTEFQGRDPRMIQTIQGPGYIQEGGNEVEKVNFYRTQTGYRIIKYIRNSAPYDQGAKSDTDCPNIRYAEVLLNYAEAKAELGTLDQTDIDNTINVIRARAGVAALTMPTTPDALMKQYYPNAKGTQLAAILEVRRERTVELVAEGFRQWDLIRWKEGKWLTPKATGGFQGVYVPELKSGLDFDGDGSPDAFFYKGAKPSGISKEIPNDNIIQLGTIQTISGANNGFLTVFAAENYSWNEDRDYLWPIPLTQIQATGGALTQNPGWDDIDR